MVETDLVEDVELTADDIARLAKAAGLPVADADLPEVTTRVNALLEGLAAWDGQPLDRVQPVPALPLPADR